jgi:hypothetical protein
MALSFHKEVTTPEALASSIEIDHHVLRWFSLLIVQPAIRVRQIHRPKMVGSYRMLKVLIIAQYVWHLAVGGSLFILLYLRNYSGLWWMLTLIVPAILLQQALKKCAQEIGMDIVGQDFDPAGLRQKTLYQISEFYSRKYGVPSIVDNIFVWDNTSRLVVIGGAIFAGELAQMVIKVYRISFVLTFLTIIAAAYFIFSFLHTFILYKNLRISLPTGN